MQTSSPETGALRRLGALSLTSLCIAAVLAGCAPPEDNLLAKVGDKSVTIDDFRQEMIRQFRTAKDAGRQPMEKREAVLDQMVEQELKLASAREDGFFETDDARDKYEDFLREALIQKLYKAEILDRMITDEVLRNTYEKQGTEVKAAHILLNWSEDSAAVMQRALEIHKEVEAGLAFADAAERYTEEPGGQGRKGDLGWFTWGRMVPAFQEACWGMEVGDLSQPVETQFGVHLIQLKDRRTVEHRPSFDDQREALVRNAQMAMKTELQEMGEKYLADMREEYGFQIQEGVPEELLTDIQKSTKEDARLTEILNRLSKEKWTNRALADWDTDALELVEMADWLEKNYRPPSSVTTSQNVVEMIEGATMFPMLERRAKERGLDKEQEVLDGARERLERTLLLKYDREYIKPRTEVSDEEVEAYYNSHLKDYMHPRQVQVQEIYVKDEQLASSLSDQAKKGADFGALAKQHTERPGKQDTDGTLDPFSPGRYGKMGEAAFTMEAGDISEPLQIGRSWSVIKLLEKYPPKQKRLDEAQTSIRMKLEREAREKGRSEWLDEASAKFGVTKYADRLKSVFAD